MDINTATVAATLIVGFLAPVIVQVSKKYIPSGWTALYSTAVSLLLSVIAVGATGGFDHTSWGVALLATVGVAQTVYAAVNAALNGKTQESGDTPSITK